VDWVRDGREAEAAAGNGVYDLVLLDLGLPRRDGLAILRALRARGESVPVLIITARDAVADRVAGLDAGADDYLVKPFDLDELSARVRAVLRRRAGRTESVLRVGGLELDAAARRVRWKGREVALSAREYALLEALADRPGAYLTRAQLEERLYGWDEEIASNAVEVHIHALRRKLDPALIRNVRGMGYTLAKDGP
jgi:two-component system response regulator QseB